MTSEDLLHDGAPRPNRFEAVLSQYVIGLAVLMMVMGLRQWAVILGILPGPSGPFEDMTTPWAIVTVHVAIVDVVAAVGLWNQAAWGKVLWIYAALFEIVVYTLLQGTFGTDWVLVGLHFTTLAVFVLLTLFSRRANPE